MSKRKIRVCGDPLLRKKSEPVKKVTADVKKLIVDMFETMDAAHGQGLAAPQIGVLKRVIVVEPPAKKDEPKQRFALINPKLLSFFGDRVEIDEGCLSVPGVYGPVTRPDGVKVEYLDERGKKQRLDASGALARVIQHEADHLDGILYFDHAGIPEEKIKKLIDEYLKEKAEHGEDGAMDGKPSHEPQDVAFSGGAAEEKNI